MDELIFQYLPIHIDVDQSFGPLNRPNGTVAIFLRDKNGHWVLGNKSNFYPDGISRMLGGGIDDNEHPSDAAHRELLEEVGVDIDQEKFVPLLHAEITTQNPQLTTSIFVYYCQTFNDIVSSDDIDSVVHFNDRELNELIHRYAQLSDSPIQPDQAPTWADYGLIWGPIHAAALIKVKELGL